MVSILSNILFLILLLVSFVSADLLRKFDAAEMNDPCDSGKGSYKLETICATKGIRRQGYLIDYGAVVCCPKATSSVATGLKPKGQAAQEYCKKNGWGISIIDFHILNGREANVGDFPQMVALFGLDANNQSTLLCGGSLITEKFVLTAAHCFNGRTKKYFVRMGRVSR